MAHFIFYDVYLTNIITVQLVAVKHQVFFLKDIVVLMCCE